MIIHYEIAMREQFEILEGIHRGNSLIILLDGAFDYTTQNTTKRVTPLSPMLFKYGVSYKKTVVRPIRYIIIRFLQLQEDIGIFPHYRKEDRLRLEDSVRRLEQAISKNEAPHLVEHFVNDILFMAQTPQKAEEDSITTVAQYLHEHYAEKLSLELLAEMAGYSKQTLIHKFRERYGKTPIEYLTAVRINQAKLLLVNTHRSVGQIAKLCGYENTYYFSNTFKKQVQMSPLQFRQKSII